MRGLTNTVQTKKDCRRDYDSDDDAGKNQSGSEDAPAAIGTSPGRMAHPIPTIRAELLRSFVSHFSLWLFQDPLPFNLHTVNHEP
jgi:hypothetical protein